MSSCLINRAKALIPVLALSGALSLAAPFNAHAVSGSSGNSDQAADGLSLIEAGRFTEAAKILGVVYRRNPSPEIEQALARARLGAGDFEGALTVLRDDAQVGDQRARSLLRIEALLRLRRFDEALFEAGAEAFAEDPAFWFNAARAHYGKGDHKSAAAICDEVIRSGFDLGEAWRFRARIALDGNQFDYARKALTRAEEAGAKADVLSPLRVEADIREGKFAKARKAIEASKKSGANLSPYTVYLDAFLDAALGEYRAAARKFASIEYFLHSDERGVVAFAIARFLEGGEAQARTLLEQHFHASKLDWVARDQLVVLLIDAGDYENAELLIGDYESLPGGKKFATLRRYQLAVKRRQYDKAYAIINRMARKGYSQDLNAAVSSAASIFGPQSALVQARAAKEQSDLQSLKSLKQLLFETPALDGNAASGAAAGPDTAPIALTILGEHVLAAGDLNQAAQHFDRALSLAPAFSKAARLRRLTDIRAGRDVSAAQALSAFARVQENDDAATLERAARALRDKDWDAATVLLAISRKDHRWEMLRFVLAAQLFHHTDNPKAGRTLAHTAAAAGADTRQRILAANIFEQAGDNRAAIETLKQALAITPEDHALLRQFEAAADRLGEKDEAGIFLRVLAKRSASSRAPRYALALRALREGDEETFRTQQEYFKALDGPYFAWLEIERLIAEGDAEKARKAMQRLAARRRAEAFGAHVEVALLRRLGDLDEAERRLEGALAAAPSDSALWLALGKFLLETGRDGARAAMRSAYLVSGRSPDATAHYAAALWRDRDTARALQLTREAAWLGAPVEEVSLKLAEALKNNGNISLCGVILAQIMAAPTTMKDSESARAVENSLQHRSPKRAPFKDLRG